MITSRRVFLAGSASLFVTSTLNKSAFAASGRKTNLIVVMLRGGMDGLAAVPFTGDDTLTKVRPDINVRQPMKLNGDFALHPELQKFKALWDRGKASVFHATSIPYTGRSHFEGQYLMESGGTVPYYDKTGWLGRALEGQGRKSLSISLPMPLLLRGSMDLDNFLPSSNPLPDDNILTSLANNYANEKMLSTAIETIRKRPVSMTSMRSRGDDSDVSSLASVAAQQLADPSGPSIAVFDIGGFDTHAGQGGDRGEHAQQLGKFDRIIGTLESDLGDVFDDTIIVSLTEFGRTLEQNGGSGTEHGYGTAILMAGGLLPKSQIIGDWPGLKKSKLFEGRDLDATIDARAVYASVIAHVLGTDHKEVVRDAFFSADLPDMTTRIFG
jgi:uncharacterized protein (DUF1501 family)